MVAYDLPATFQYVYDQTGQKLHYVGHSQVGFFFFFVLEFAASFQCFQWRFQGTLIALAALSKDQLLNMLRSAALLCPIAYMGQMTSPLAKNAADNFIAEVKS